MPISHGSRGNSPVYLAPFSRSGRLHAGATPQGYSACDGLGGQHLHEFVVGAKRYGRPDLDADDPELLDERKARIRDLGLPVGGEFDYRYDFGDDWRHVITLKELVSAEAQPSGPICLAGERRAPPEDAGGVDGDEESCRLYVIQDERSSGKRSPGAVIDSSRRRFRSALSTGDLHRNSALARGPQENDPEVSFVGSAGEDDPVSYGPSSSRTLSCDPNLDGLLRKQSVA
jgi:hypothetical protein